MNDLTNILSRYLPDEYTAVSYAISVGDKVYSGGCGEGDIGKSTFNVASVSKVYCAVAVMQLVQRGTVSLDTPVVNYLKDLEYKDKRFEKVTLRQCLSHSCGLPGTQWKGFSVLSEQDEDYYSYVREYLKHNMLKEEPGVYSVYCNDGFTIAEMVVAQMSGMSYSEYVKTHITEPIGAHSTRFADTLNAEYPLVKPKKKTSEKLLCMGAAGVSTTMLDLIPFGKLFLKENSILTEHSKEEMAKKQGKTFLSYDQKSELYGLGWDNVDYRFEGYNLGDNVLQKGGNSFRFSTQFLVVPKYNAVLAISQSHDCKLDHTAVLLRLFAALMAQQSENIISGTHLPSKTDIEAYSGDYFVPSAQLCLKIEGSTADIIKKSYRDKERTVTKALHWVGGHFVDDKNHVYLLEKHEGKAYMLTELNGRLSPMAQKAQPMGEWNSAWDSRLGKLFVAVDFTKSDIVISDIMTGFAVEKSDVQGVYMLSFSGRSDTGVYGFFEAAVIATSDDEGASFLSTPGNPSRDLIYPEFYSEGGSDFCKVASYKYQAVQSLPVYNGETFEQGAGIYRIESKLETLPDCPEEGRILVMNDKAVTVYDSLSEAEYKPLEQGIIAFVK